jgi:hypothetical protein
MVNLNNKIWDVAVPSLLVQEAGGHFTDLRGKVLQFELGEGAFRRNYAVIAGAPTLHTQALRLISETKMFDTTSGGPAFDTGPFGANHRNAEYKNDHPTLQDSTGF